MDETVGKTMEEMLSDLREKAPVEIKMTARGVEFLNDYEELVGLIPFAGTEGS